MKVRVTLEAIVEAGNVSQAASSLQTSMYNATQQGGYTNWVQPLRITKLEEVPEPPA